MSDYQQFLHERDQIDFLLTKGYRIKDIAEDLNGAKVEFEKKDYDNKELTNKEILYIYTADGRKYFSVKLMEQFKR